MPLLVLWTSAVCALRWHGVGADQLDISYSFFIETLPRVVPPANLYIALAKGAAFELLIALVACHFGLRVKPIPRACRRTRPLRWSVRLPW